MSTLDELHLMLRARKQTREQLEEFDRAESMMRLYGYVLDPGSRLFFPPEPSGCALQAHLVIRQPHLALMVAAGTVNPGPLRTAPH